MRPLPIRLIEELRANPERAVHIVEQRAQLGPVAQVFATEALSLREWEKTQKVYRFDPTFAAAIMDTPLTQELPTGIFAQLPVPSVWIELDEEPLRGWFVTTHGIKTGLMVHAFTADEYTYRSAGAAVLASGTSLQAALDRALVDSFHSPRDARIPGLAAGVFLALYLCAEKPDITTTRTSVLNEQRIRRGKLPYHPTEYAVGYRIGAEFRKVRAALDAARGDGTRTVGPQPHVRRAHWHAYWVGPRNEPEKRHLELRWIAPVYVNATVPEDLTPTVHPVHPESR